MTIFNNSVFFTPSKFIKINVDKFNVLSGANVLANLPLCGVKIDYVQYQRISVQVPKGQVDFVLSFPMLGIKPTFITILPKYVNVDPNLRYLKWKFQSSSDAKWSMTSILSFSGTVANPIPPILIDNPDADCPVQLEILVAALENDYLNDIAAFVYLNELTFDKIHTFNETNSNIITIFNSANELVTSIDIPDIVNVSRLYNTNRIIIDEASNDNIVLDFLTEYDTLQALSALTWVLADPTNRALPQIADIIAPVITYDPSVVANQLDVDLSLFVGSTFSKQDFIDTAIDIIVDNRDGVITAIPANIIFKQGTVLVNTIVLTGNYTVDISITDIAGNIVTDTIDLTVANVIVDTIPPVIYTTTEVIGSNINTFALTTYSGIFTPNDARLLCLLSVVDNIDGTLPISGVAVQFLDNLLAPVATIVTPGSYSIIFTATDAALNNTILSLNIIIS